MGNEKLGKNKQQQGIKTRCMLNAEVLQTFKEIHLIRDYKTYIYLLEAIKKIKYLQFSHKKGLEQIFGEIQLKMKNTLPVNQL